MILSRISPRLDLCITKLVEVKRILQRGGDVEAATAALQAVEERLRNLSIDAAIGYVNSIDVER